MINFLIFHYILYLAWNILILSRLESATSVTGSTFKLLGTCYWTIHSLFLLRGSSRIKQKTPPKFTNFLFAPCVFIRPHFLKVFATTSQASSRLFKMHFAPTPILRSPFPTVSFYYFLLLIMVDNKVGNSRIQFSTNNGNVDKYTVT